MLDVDSFDEDDFVDFFVLVKLLLVEKDLSSVLIDALSDKVELFGTWDIVALFRDEELLVDATFELEEALEMVADLAETLEPVVVGL